MSVCYVRVAFRAGVRKVRAEVLNRLFAIHPYVTSDPGDAPNGMWTVSHRNTGWRVVTVARKSDGRTVAHLVQRVAKAHGLTFDISDPYEPRSWPKAARKAIQRAVSFYDTGAL